MRHKNNNNNNKQKKTNKQKNKFIHIDNRIVVTREEVESGEDKEENRVKYTVMKGGLTLGGVVDTQSIQITY